MLLIANSRLFNEQASETWHKREIIERRRVEDVRPEIESVKRKLAASGVPVGRARAHNIDIPTRNEVRGGGGGDIIDNMRAGTFPNYIEGEKI